MSNLSLKQIREKLLSSQNKENQSTNDGAVYPFWNIPDGEIAAVRFLPDGDPNSPYFWRERQIIKLKFDGIKGQTDKPTEVQVPCMEMWNETCPVLTEIRPWFKDPQLEETARQYWKKRSYLFQGFVRINPLKEDTQPENPIRRLVINKPIFNVIHNGILDPELEEIPCDYTHGVDFRIAKTKNGQYADYSTSTYSRKTSPLTAEELQAIETYGLFTLEDFLPKKPDDAHLRAISEMFQASVDGEAYDPDRWSNFYRPYGMKKDENSNASNSTPTSTTNTSEVAESTASQTVTQEPSVQEPVQTQAQEPAVQETVTPAADDAAKKKSPQELLAEIAARRQAQ